jgi:hypothetical protein
MTSGLKRSMQNLRAKLLGQGIMPVLRVPRHVCDANTK